MRNRAMLIFSIILLSIVVLLLIGFMIYALNGRHPFNFKRVSENKIHDETYTYQFKKIDITSDAADVEVKLSDSNEFRLVIYGKEDLLKVATSSRELKVNIKSEKCFGFCFNTTMFKTILYVPKNYGGEIKIENKYGDVKIEDLKNANIILDVSYGDIDMQDVRKADIDNSYGDIKIGNVEDATVKAACGDIDIRTIQTGKIKNNLGDIKIGRVEKSIEIDEDCGNVEIDSLNIENDSHISNSLGDVRLGTTNEIYIDAKTSLGDVKIANNYRQSMVTLKIENSAGDIIVKN